VIVGNLVSYILKGIIPIIIVLVVLYGVIKKVKVYECFVEGSKDGISICLRIFPYLLAMIIAVNVFRASGALDFFIRLVKPVVKFIGLSGSGALGVFTDIIKQYGPDSYIGRVSSIIMGSTETIFYTLTVYFGAVNVKNIRHTLVAAILADITAVIMAVNLAKFFF